MDSDIRKGLVELIVQYLPTLNEIQRWVRNDFPDLAPRLPEGQVSRVDYTVALLELVDRDGVPLGLVFDGLAALPEVRTEDLLNVAPPDWKLPGSDSPVSSSSSRGDEVGILHLTDLPLTGSESRLPPVLIELIAAAARHGDIDLICVSGSVTATGTPRAYGRARSFLDKLAGGLHLGRRRCVVVPGVGDVPRGGLDPRSEAVLRELHHDADEAVIKRALHSDDLGANGRLQAYSSFARQFGAYSSSPWFPHPIDIGSRRVHVAGICPSLFTLHDPNEGALPVGIDQISGARPPSSSHHHFDVVLTHRLPQRQRDQDALGEWLTGRDHVILHADPLFNGRRKAPGPGPSLETVAARPADNSFNIVKLQPGHTPTVTTFRWFERAGVWEPER